MSLVTKIFDVFVKDYDGNIIYTFKFYDLSNALEYIMSYNKKHERDCKYALLIK